MHTHEICPQFCRSSTSVSNHFVVEEALGSDQSLMEIGVAPENLFRSGISMSSIMWRLQLKRFILPKEGPQGKSIVLCKKSGLRYQKGLPSR